MRYGLDIFRRFFDAIVQQCQEAKLVWGKELYIDSTQVNANAAMDSLVTRFAVEAREAIQTHLAALFTEATSPEEPPKATGQEDFAGPSPMSFPVVLSEPEREELEAELSTRHDWIKEEGRQQRDVRGLYQRRSDQRISTTDPDATPMRLKSGGLHLGYHTHYVVDGGKRRIILAALVTPAEVMDNQPMLDLLWHVRFRWHLRPRQATGDTKYGTIENIKALEDQGICAYIPLPNWEHMTAYYGPSHFTYDSAHDLYICPNNQPLHLSRMEYKAEKAEYRADPATCNACPLKAQCTPSDQGRQVHRSFHASYLERVRGYQQTLAYQKALNKRKVWVEPLFAEGKDWHGMRRFRLRRLWRVNCEALVIATGQNLKRLLQKRGWGRRPFPVAAVSAVPPPDWQDDEQKRFSALRRKGAGFSIASMISLSTGLKRLERVPSLFSCISLMKLFICLLLLCTPLNQLGAISLFLLLFQDRKRIEVSLSLSLGYLSSTEGFSTGCSHV
jgi:hypothetical protein